MMNEMEQKQEIDSVLNSIYESINKGIKPKEIEIEYMLDMSGRGKLSKQQIYRFNNVIQQINKLYNTNDNQKALVQKKDNFFMKLPGIRNIINWMNQRKQQEFIKKEEKQDEIKLQNETSRMQFVKGLEAKQNKLEQRNIIKPEPKEELIAISDLHSRIDRWEFVKQHINNNPKAKFIILGDAMDRGEYGVEILLQIKELSDQGKVKYLPGNHDLFAYNYLKSIEMGDTNTKIYKQALGNLERNGGKHTLNKLNNFRQTITNAKNTGLIKNEIELSELTNWLGKCPIQMTTKQNGINYALSHAIFDTKLYQADPEFNLEKAYDLERTGNNKEMLNRFLNCMWYRKEDAKTQYAPICPPKDYVMVVGHTRQNEVNIKNIANRYEQQAIYIDTGKAENLQGFNLTTGKSIVLEGKEKEER